MFKKRHSQELSLTDMLLFPQKWKQYKKRFKKKYSDSDEETIRKQIYFSRYALIEQNNKRYKEKLTQFKINPTVFSDQTEDEIADYYSVSGTQGTSNIVVGENAEEKWQQFKKRMKKKFNSESQEDIPKFFFFSKLREVNHYVNELKKLGLALDLKGLDQYCDFRNENSAQTLVDDIQNAENRRRSSVDQTKRSSVEQTRRSTIDKTRRKSSMFL